MDYLYSIIVNNMKERYRLRKCLTGKWGLGEKRNNNVPDNMRDGR